MNRKRVAKVITVVDVDGRRFSTVDGAVQAIAWKIAMVFWSKHRDKYYHGENYKALDRLDETARRRITPIIQKVLA